MALFAQKTWLRKSHVLFALRIMGFPQELETMRFNFEPKRCKSVSLSAKRSVSWSSNGETAFSVKFPAGPGEATENHYLSRLPQSPKPPYPPDPHFRTEMEDRRGTVKDTSQSTTLNYLFGVSRNSQLPFLASFLV